MRIVVDAMGSDRAPLPEVSGAVEASTTSDVEVILVGDENELNETLSAYPDHGKISIVHASEVITMHDSPVMAVRKKKDSSILVGLRLLKEGKADGMVSAGNTGAFMVGSRTVLGPIRGVARSAICQMLPTEKDPVLTLDLGANADCTARHLCEFAEMGMLYSKLALNVDNPRVGLLNIGEEVAKGNELAKTVHKYLTAHKGLKFIGNIEPKALFRGDADVVVCDGFVGNVVLKTSEAIAGLLTTLLKRELTADLLSKMGAFLSRGAYSRFKTHVDSDYYAGAPLLGVNGVVIIIHGGCSSKAVANAIQGASRAAECGLSEQIRVGVQELRDAEDELDHQEELV